MGPGGLSMANLLRLSFATYFFFLDDPVNEQPLPAGLGAGRILTRASKTKAKFLIAGLRVGL
jgi:hypothetical protein